MSDSLDINSIMEARRKAVEKTIRSIGAADLTALIDEIFPYFDDPWRHRFAEFVQENGGSSFYHATTNDPLHILYCSTKDKGIWYVPGSGVGILQQRGLDILKNAVGKL